MEPEGSKSKQKQSERANLDKWLHPRSWRGRKKEKSVSPSRSPSVSPPSTPGEASTSKATQFDQSLQSSINRQLPLREYDLYPDMSSTTIILSYDTTQDPACIRGNSTAQARNPTDTTCFGLERALRRLHNATSICPPLHSAVDGLRSCLHIFEEAANNRREYEVLTAGLNSTAEQLVSHMHAAPSEDIIDAISLISDVINKEIVSISTRQSRSGVRRMLDASEEEEDLFRCYRRIEQLFRQLQGEASMSAWVIISKQYINTLLESLNPAKTARFDSMLSAGIGRRTCTENTRTQILQESMEWSEDPNGAKIYWMNGMAGTGKTTITCSLCEALDARKQLAASFFCTRTSPECREAGRIVPTIAYQLARRSTPFRSALCKALEEDPDISVGNISSQFNLLLKRPLIRVKEKLSDNLVVVVDALDECSDPYLVESFLELLFLSIEDLPIKFYVTSRPEPTIRNKIMSESERSRSILYLHEIDRTLVQADIELYLRGELAFMSPGLSDVAKLAEHAGNLFIYAATVVRYIRPIGKVVNSRTRLSAMLAVNAESKKKLSGIDALYSAILTTALDDDDLEPEERDDIRLVLWTSICICEPVLISTLSALCGLDSKDSIVQALEPPRSVLHISDHNGFVTTLHASFADYMLARDRSGVFFCDQNTHSQFLAEQCFKIMQAQLRFNICSIRTSFIPDTKVAGLEERTATNISGELHYACRYWTDHLSQTDPTNSLLSLLHDFLSQRLLFWMEVLNLKRCLVTGVVSGTKLNRWLAQIRDLDAFPQLYKLASSAYKFGFGYVSSPASAYTPHIYLSALPLSPPSSPVRLRYLPRFKGLVQVHGTHMNRLEGSALSTWQSKDRITSAAFSPDGDLIILGSFDGKISVRNVYNGEYHTQPFQAHEYGVTCMGISSNGVHLVSGSTDSTLRVWNIQNRSLIPGLSCEHTGSVRSANFSPDGTHIVSGSEDCTIGIWNLRDISAPKLSLEGHTKPVNSVAFSPDGTHLVSGSLDHTVRLWDISIGTNTHILRHHTLWVTFVRFSPDGSYIISGSADRTICIWRASDGTLCNQPLRGHFYAITSLAVSHEGDYIASGSDDYSVRLWNRHTGELAAGPFEGHSDSIIFVGFSNDGIRLVSVSRDGAVRVWNAHDETQQTNHLSKTARISNHYPELTISPDQTQLAIFECAAYTRHSTIDIWDLRTTTLATSISLSSGSKINFLQFSLDGIHIFTLHDSNEICTWSIPTGQLVDGPHTCLTTQACKLVACSPDAGRAVGWGGETFELWDLQSHQTVAFCEMSTGIEGDSQPKVPCYRPTPIFMFSHERTLATSSPGTYIIQVWDAENGTCIAGPFMNRELLDISLDGATLLCLGVDHRTSNFGADSRRIQLIDVGNGNVEFMANYRERFELKETHVTSKNKLSSAKFSLDGLNVVYNTPTGLYGWNLLDQTTTEPITFHPSYFGDLESIACTLDGRCLAISTFAHQMVRVWRFNIGQPFCPTIRPDGWLLDAKSQPLFWVPAEIGDEFPRGNGAVIGKHGGLHVDYDGMLVGDDWSQCYIGD